MTTAMTLHAMMAQVSTQNTVGPTIMQYSTTTIHLSEVYIQKMVYKNEKSKQRYRIDSKSKEKKRNIAHSDRRLRASTFCDVDTCGNDDNRAIGSTATHTRAGMAGMRYTLATACYSEMGSGSSSNHMAISNGSNNRHS